MFQRVPGRSDDVSLLGSLSNDYGPTVKGGYPRIKFTL
jgi:hypothetical protein